MRNDTLNRIKNWESFKDCKQYIAAKELLSECVGNFDGWDLLIDYQQISTRQAGKSSCAFFAKAFNDYSEAVGLMEGLHKRFPKVNLEFAIMPDGIFDYGDGFGSYSHVLRDKPHLPKNRLSYYLMVDVQNLLRYTE